MNQRPIRLGSLPLVLALVAVPVALSAQTAKPPSAEETREANLRVYVELLRSDVRAQAVAIITEVMEFSEAEDAKFWPVYRDFERDLAALNDQRLALIKEYADNYTKMTDAVADKLARGVLDLEGKRHELKMKYYDRFKSVLTPKMAAKFLQVENQILLLLDLQLASSLPIVQ